MLLTKRVPQTSHQPQCSLLGSRQLIHIFLEKQLSEQGRKRQLSSRVAQREPALLVIPPFASQGEAPASLTATHCVLRLMLSSPGRSFFFLFISSLANGSSPRVLFIPTSMHHFALGHIKLPFFLLFPSKFPMRMLNPCPSMGSLPFHPLTPLPCLSPSNSPNH